MNNRSPYKVKWYTEPNNFGDMLTPHILKHFNVPFVYVDKITESNLICVGSIARLATKGMIVLGSGVIRKNEKSNPEAIWKFVRGPLTRDNIIRCGGLCPKIYGDPALLLPLFCSESIKQYDVGIVPHYNDYKIIKSKYPKYKIINMVNENPLVVAKEITKCRKIISSSLHGIICAHAFGIPAAWIEFSKLFGDGSKFKDYFASANLKEQQPSTITEPSFTLNNNITLDPMIRIFKSLKNE